ncbi:S8 family serine peptidase [Pleurocapsales cyanobacterium LEGE 10410]|nr:S8 family serine peptidase [Pleurocapsales cyanobacterium LEGE 10410]
MFQASKKHRFSFENDRLAGDNQNNLITSEILDSNLLFRELNNDLLDFKPFVANTTDIIISEIDSTNELLELSEEVGFVENTSTANNNFSNTERSSVESIDSSNTNTSFFNNDDFNFIIDDASLATAQATNSAHINYSHGTLEADTFTIDPRYSLNVISGNGNIEYSDGERDLLDLSEISIDRVNELSFAQIDGGGTIFDSGQGDRVFDFLTLDNGDTILFEGIDRILFSDYEYDLAVDPNDPGFEDQWNLHLMGVQNAWRFTTGSDRVLVGVQDSGLGMFEGDFHPDLVNTIYYPDNVADEFFREVSGDSHQQNSSHGTAVQGIIAAATDNGTGIAGINWNCDVFNIDVLDANNGDFSPAEATQAMINHANSQGQRLVINMSFGGGRIDPAFEELVANNQDNALFVIATGNQSNSSISDLSSFADIYDNVIAVGAIEADGSRAPYSNYGQGITLVGPTDVPSTGAFPDQRFGYHAHYDDNLFNGTSAATPNVAGVASLVWSANPNLSAAGVRYILSETAFDLGNQGYDLEYGHGLVNADAAVRRAIALSHTNSNDLSALDSAANFNEADHDFLTGSDRHSQVAFAEDSMLLTPQALDRVSLELLENTSSIFSLGTSNSEVTTQSPDFLEGLNYSSDLASLNNLGEENFYNTVEI